MKNKDIKCYRKGTRYNDKHPYIWEFKNVKALKAGSVLRQAEGGLFLTEIVNGTEKVHPNLWLTQWNPNRKAFKLHRHWISAFKEIFKNLKTISKALEATVDGPPALNRTIREVATTS